MSRRLASRRFGRSVAALTRSAITAVMVNSCGGDITVTNPEVKSVSLSSPAVSLEVGETQTISAAVAVSDKAATTVSWQSVNPAVVTVRPIGTGNEAEITGVSIGTAVIRAASTYDRTKSADVQVTVGSAAVSVVAIAPTTPAVIRGLQTSLSATPKSGRGTPIPGRNVLWESTNPAIATVSSLGDATGVSVGSVTIKATIDGVVGAVALDVIIGPVDTVKVSPANLQMARGGTQSLTLTLRDAGGNSIDPPTKAVDWASTRMTVATVSNAGVMTAVAAGQTDVTATVEGKSASASVTVTDPPPASIEILVRDGTVEEGKTLQLSTVVKDAGGATLYLAPSWQSLDANIATVSANGLVTGVTAGSSRARIIASLPTLGSPISDTTSVAVGYPGGVGAIVVSVAGLADGVDAALALTGPDNIRRAVTASTTVLGLRPGKYDVVLDSVKTREQVYQPSAVVPSVTVVAGQNTPLNVAYVPTLGQLQVTVALPSGCLGGDIRVFGPTPPGLFKFGRSQTLIAMRPGTYSIRGNWLGDGQSGACLSTQPDQNVVVKAGGIAAANVPYVHGYLLTLTNQMPSNGVVAATAASCAPTAVCGQDFAGSGLFYPDGTLVNVTATANVSSRVASVTGPAPCSFAPAAGDKTPSFSCSIAMTVSRSISVIFAALTP